MYVTVSVSCSLIFFTIIVIFVSYPFVTSFIVISAVPEVLCAVINPFSFTVAISSSLNVYSSFPISIGVLLSYTFSVVSLYFSLFMSIWYPVSSRIISFSS